MRGILILFLWGLRLCKGLSDEHTVGVEVGPDGVQSVPVPALSPTLDNDNEYDMPVLSEDGEYTMPTDLIARLTGIGVEPSDEALEWAQNHRSREGTIINKGDEPLYLYLWTSDEKKIFITRIKDGETAIIDCQDGERFSLNDNFEYGFYISNVMAEFTIESEVWEYVYEDGKLNGVVQKGAPKAAL